MNPADGHRWHTLERLRLEDLSDTACALSWILQLLDRQEVAAASNHSGGLTESIQEGCRSLVEEIPSLLLLQIASADRGNLLRVPTGILALIQRAIGSARHFSCARGKTIVPSVPDGDILVDTQPALLEDVVKNLLRAALQAAPAGAEVQVECEARAHNLGLTVWGPGILPDRFHAFVERKLLPEPAPRELLGLYSAILIAESCLGGRFVFNSSASVGSRFLVVLPIR